ncbi:hypothetical protein PHYBOEH_010638 [Phytophthora boehmeriae]|uniref:Nucleoplasmin-like domain-containing protein n=1 Tax=Phytophthora boehmeriae TaxID=109152 RepID=A0A8T1X2M9_9STRA|nr:hypothetical protein PHYBOEH_010638 [Phytophthora boehmeriae]
MSFWGCEVTETKAAVVAIPEGFVLNVVNATCSASNAGDTQLALALETQQVDGKAWKGAVAHLGHKQPLQVKLDLVFGHKIKFYLSKGEGAVNLTGYFQPGPVSEVDEADAPSADPSTKKSKKRAREEKSWDQISSSDSEETPAKEVTPAKASKPEAIPAKKEEQKKPKQVEAVSSVSVNGNATQGKKKRKKNKKANKPVSN